jgi:hypothetical protein
MTKRKIYSVESHEQVLQVWRDQGVRQANVLHLDFHCDLRGLLINRKTQKAFRIWDRHWKLDEGNFLTHAVLEGVVTGIRWVHDEPGGRKDDLKTVKYESDLSALVHRTVLKVRRCPGIPIHFKVMPKTQWREIKAGEILDIDWDFFASCEYPKGSIQNRVESFLSRDWSQIPEQTFVCYSPNYSHSTRTQFRDFINNLASKFDAEIVEVPKPSSAKVNAFSGKSTLKPLIQPARQIYHSACHALRRHGIF